jgi:hypothetical protein
MKAAFILVLLFAPEARTLDYRGSSGAIPHSLTVG